VEGVDWGAYSSFHSLRPRMPELTTAMQVVSSLGSYVALGVVLLAAATWLVMRQRVRTALLLVAVVVAAAALVELLKLAIRRDRPPDWDGSTGTPFSFPSAAAFVSVVLYGALAWVVLLRITSWKARSLLLAGALIIVLAIGASQLYLGAQLLSDVLAGWAGGLALLLAWSNLVQERLAFPSHERERVGPPTAC
jgi:membrane-associated phospholipid phosphatase